MRINRFLALNLDVSRRDSDILVENNKIFEEAERIINLKDTKPKKIKFWDKKVSSRIFKIINESSWKKYTFILDIQEQEQH